MDLRTYGYGSLTAKVSAFPNTKATRCCIWFEHSSGYDFVP